MYRSLSAGAIGIRVSWEEEVELAAQYGFQGVGIGMDTINRLGLDKVRRILSRHGVMPAMTGLPVHFPGEQADYDKQVAALPQFCWTMAELGVERICSGIMPCSDTLTFEQNWELHRKRIGPAAAVLADYGLRLGFEFISPMTLRLSKKYQFIYDIGGYLKLFEAIGARNLGFVLDSWHWYEAHNTLKDLDLLSDETVLLVHVNDAPAGIDIDQQMDLVRELPAATGVIDIHGFMGKLAAMHYTGPVLVEPFNATVYAMPKHEALAATQRSLDKIWPKL